MGEGHCPACWLVQTSCVCAHRPTIDTPTRFIIVRHWKERHRPSNTGRFAPQCLSNTTLVDHGAPGSRWDPTVLDGTKPCVLFPGEGGPEFVGMPETIVLLDGTWPQARKMLRRVPGLNALPRLSLPPPAGLRLRLRRPPTVHGMATLEAVAQCLRHLGQRDAADALDTFFDAFVAASLKTRGTLPRPR